METEIITAWAKEVLSVAILGPIVWYFIRANQKNVESSIHMVEKKFDELYKKLEDINRSVGKTTLSDSQLISIARARVWRASEKKLEMIKRRLKKNNIKDRKEIIKKQITTELERLSKVYVDELNEYTSSVGPIGDWIDKNFPMKDFLDEIFDVIFTDETHYKGKEGDEIILAKIEDCSFIMKSYQMQLWEDLKKALNGKK